MGIFKMFSSSSYDDNRPSWERGEFKETRKPTVTLPNPDPKNYVILGQDEIGRYLILTIQYPDCTNYEGKKILVFKDTTITALKKQGSIDPHFSDNKEMVSPIARFEPTLSGIKSAMILCYSLTQIENTEKF